MTEQIQIATENTPTGIESNSNLELRDLLRKRVEDKSLFHSEKDISIATDFLDRLDLAFDYGHISKESYKSALEGMDVLIPKRNDAGWRVVGGINISPIMELTIGSRINSKEVDLTSKDSSWGSLPLAVKEEVAEQSNLIVELTPTCTVRCSFCALAEKGPIAEKVSLSSLADVLRFYRDNRKIPEGLFVSDAMYWGSDPFDAKWKKADGTDYDYLDAANMYWNLMKGRSRFLYTSTAIPIGEELRVLNFADNFLNKKQNNEIDWHSYFRISLTNANKSRVEAIRKVLTVLYPKFPKEFEISRNRNDYEARAGKRWQQELSELKSWDIIGPNCRDDVIVSTHSVDAVIMEGSSNERPKGESRFPITDRDSDDKIVYTIPHHQESGSFGRDIFNLYPNTVVTVIRESNRGLQKSTETITKNPHRAFLRLVANVQALVEKHGNITKISRREKNKYKSMLADDISLVKSYLDSGADNSAMEHFIKFYTSLGFFK